MFSPGIAVSFTSKDITEILLKVALSTTTPLYNNIKTYILDELLRSN
jgi:hypothetical protein